MLAIVAAIPPPDMTGTYLLLSGVLVVVVAIVALMVLATRYFR